MIKTFNALLDEFEQDLANRNWSRPPHTLYSPIEYILSLGGKRVRPILTLMACNLYDTNYQKALPAAYTVELYHNSSLLHDDIMDQADVRRGKPVANKIWGDNAALLSGDALLIKAFDLLNEYANTPYQAPLLKLFSNTALQICEGQQYDLEFETRNNVALPEYIEMIRLKTSVLLACALQMGAIIGNAPTEDQHDLYDFGQMLGIAFQIKDDLLDVYSEFEQFGKKVGGDILVNKKTFLLLTALEQGNASQQNKLRQLTSTPQLEPKDKINSTIKIYNEIGVKEIAQNAIEQYYTKAFKALDRIKLPETQKVELRTFAKQLMNRTK